jgi:predicted ATPase
MKAQAGAVRVVVATTSGPVDVLQITREERSLERSVACIDRSTTTADIDRAYDAFVRNPTGFVQRIWGHDCFRADLSSNIHDGLSWQLGLLMAHALYEAGRLAEADADATYDTLHWVTGEVRHGGLKVGQVMHVDEKVRGSLDRIRAERAAGRRVIVTYPAHPRCQPAPDLINILLSAGAEVSAVATAYEAAEQQGTPLPRPPTGQSVVPRVPATNVAHAVSPLIGRDGDIAQICRRLEAERLVTISGTGGIGKTTLAKAVGRAMLANFADGVWFVDLSAVDRRGVIAEALCSVLGVAPTDSSRSPLAAAQAFLGERRAMIILDNCEQIADGAAAVTADLLARCPGVRVLATSREPLRIAGEVSIQLSPLEAPPEGAITAAAIAECSAVRLFVDRAARRLGTFELTDATAGAVAAICRLVDGLPLGIELATGRLGVHTLDVMAERLREIIATDVLVQRDLPSRHRTIHALVQSSVDLCAPDEQALFAALGTFVGGFTLEAVQRVVDPAGTIASVSAKLAVLTERSMISTTSTAAGVRHVMLETARQHARRMLTEEHADVLRARHAAAMVEHYERGAASWPTAGTEAWLAVYEPDVNNLRAALEWAFEARERTSVAVRLTAASLRLWDELSLPLERERWFAMATERLGEGTPKGIEAVLWLGRTSRGAHGDRHSYAPARRAADLFRAAGDTAGLGEALHKTGSALLLPHSTAEALTVLREAEQELRPLGATKMLAACLRSLAIAESFAGDDAAARIRLGQSLAMARAVGDIRAEVSTQIGLAEFEFSAGRAEVAIDIAEALLDEGRATLRQDTLIRGNLAAYLIASQRIAEARVQSLASLDGAQVLGWSSGIVRAIEYLALLAAMNGHGPRAARLLGVTAAHYATGAASREYTELSAYEALTDRLEAMMSIDRIEAAMLDGATLSLERAVEIALADDGDAAPVPETPYRP